jgi:hypothetical protein
MASASADERLEALRYTLTETETRFETDFCRHYKSAGGYKKFQVTVKEFALGTNDPNRLAEIFTDVLEVKVSPQQVLDHAQGPAARDDPQAQELREFRFRRGPAPTDVTVISGPFFRRASDSITPDKSFTLDPPNVVIHNIGSRKELVRFIAQAYGITDGDVVARFLNFRTLFDAAAGAKPSQPPDSKASAPAPGGQAGKPPQLSDAKARSDGQPPKPSHPPDSKASAAAPGGPARKPSQPPDAKARSGGPVAKPSQPPGSKAGSGGQPPKQSQPPDKRALPARAPCAQPTRPPAEPPASARAGGKQSDARAPPAGARAPPGRRADPPSDQPPKACQPSDAAGSQAPRRPPALVTDWKADDAADGPSIQLPRDLYRSILSELCLAPQSDIGVIKFNIQ